MPTVADLVIQGLLRAEVARLFSVSGGGPVIETLEAAAAAHGLPVVSCHGEAAALTMAAVTGELTHRPGAACSDLVTGGAIALAHAFLDRCPVIYVSARHSEAASDRGGRRLIDHAAHLAPIVKGTLTLGPDSVSHWMAHAAQLALKEPRGPVHLDLPADLVSAGALPLAANARPAPPAPPDAALLDRAAAMIRAAQRPIVVAGLACRTADARWLRAFSEALPAPVLTTAKGKGAVPEPHPLAMGVFAGGAPDAPLMRRADLIIGFGVDPVELASAPWPWATPVLALARCSSVDLLEAARSGGSPSAADGASFAPAVEVVGDLALILEELAPRLVGGDARTDWDVAEIDRLRRERLAALEGPAGFAAQRVVRVCRELTPAGAIACIEPGPHGRAATACWQAVEPGECLISGGLGAPGFAVPAAVAAQLVHPERRVVCFTDVPGLLRSIPEVDTAARLRLPIALVVLSHRRHGDAVAGDEPPRPSLGAHVERGTAPRAVDVCGVARSLGVAGFAASDASAFELAFVRALGQGGPSVIDARLESPDSGR